MLRSALDRMFEDINRVLARAVRAASTVLLLLMQVVRNPSWTIMIGGGWSSMIGGPPWSVNSTCVLDPVSTDVPIGNSMVARLA